MHDTTQQPEILIKLERSIEEPDAVTQQEWLDQAIEDHIPAVDIRCTLIRGMETLRHRLMSSNFGLPDFLVRIDNVLHCLERLSGIEDAGSVQNSSIVIGVVQGDPHDLGKNIIAGIYRAHGYRVVDLGREVSREDFVQGVVQSKAMILGLSAMMSTTMPAMKDIIKDVKTVCPDIKVIVGGAPLNDVLARSYGADAYVESALNVIEQTRAMLDTL